jgi:hypothetical protein
MMKGLVVLSLIAAFLLPVSAAAQSCVLTRLDSPVLNAFDDEFDPAGEHQKWQLTVGWRYGYSHRHFVGTDEQEERAEENSQVVNNVNLADFSLRYNFDSRTSLTVGIPYLMATRDGALRGENREVLRRYQRSSTSGIGDVTAVAKRLMWDPSSHRRSNLSLGLGVKFPTGDYKQPQTTIEMVDGEEVATTSIADYSVQPGDGSWGFVVEASGYKVLNQSGSLAFYGSGTYILEPESTNGIDRPGADPFEEEISATDQYVARAGLYVGPSSWKGFSIGIGGRIEGIPPHDVLGSSTGRRRPGYMISAEPSVTWTYGAHSITLAVPVAIERNRQQSVSDIFLGDHGDAAFPDYLVIAGFSRRF